jgi:transposase-like protein
MSRKRFTTEQIIHKLRLAEVDIAKGKSVPEACKVIGVVEQTYYRWRKEYGGLKLDQARHFKQLERENGRLKKLVADLSLDNAILKEAANPNF